MNKVKKDRYPVLMIYFQILYVSFIQLLIGIGLNRSISLLCDAVNIILLVWLIRFYGKTKSAIRINLKFYIFYLLFFGEGTVSALFYGFDIVLWLWSLRNFGRFFVFFTACTTFLNREDFYKLKSILFKISHINFLVCLYQFVGLQKRGDYIGGIFGIEGGVANTWINTFLIVIFAVFLSEWICGKDKIIKFLIVFAEGLTIAAIAELKFFFIEVLILIIIAFGVVKKNYCLYVKFIKITGITILALAISLPILYKLFPTFDNFFNFSNIIDNAKRSYTGSGDLGRITAIEEIIDKFFEGDPIYSLIGIGLGNGQYSSHQQIFQSKFYLEYQNYKYHWFSDAVVMVETGILGVCFFAISFISVITKSYKNFVIETKRSEIFLVPVLLGTICMLLFIYNISLNTEIAYLMYAMLSFCGVSTINKYGDRLDDT